MTRLLCVIEVHKFKCMRFISKCHIPEAHSGPARQRKPEHRNGVPSLRTPPPFPTSWTLLLLRPAQLTTACFSTRVSPDSPATGQAMLHFTIFVSIYHSISDSYKVNTNTKFFQQNQPKFVKTVGILKKLRNCL